MMTAVQPGLSPPWGSAVLSCRRRPAPGAHSQAPSRDELRKNLAEVIELVLEEMAARGEEVDVDAFVGTQQIAVRA